MGTQKTKTTKMNTILKNVALFIIMIASSNLLMAKDVTKRIDLSNARENYKNITRNFGHGSKNFTIYSITKNETPAFFSIDNHTITNKTINNKYYVNVENIKDLKNVQNLPVEINDINDKINISQPRRNKTKE